MNGHFESILQRYETFSGTPSTTLNCLSTNKPSARRKVSMSLKLWQTKLILIGINFQIKSLLTIVDGQ
jgi:hypothetical protein